MLGDVLHDRSDFKQAETVYQQALALNRQLADVRGEATILNNLGVGCWRRGLLSEASEYLSAPSWRGAVPYRYGERNVDERGAALLGEFGDYREAIKRHEEALEIFRALGARAGEAYALNNIGIVERALGNDEAALRHMTQALAGFEASGEVRGQGRALVHIGQIQLAQGDLGGATGHVTQAFTHPAERRCWGGRRRARSRGAIAEMSGDAGTALKRYDEALERYRSAGSRRGEAAVLNRRGPAFFALGNADGAMESLEAALVIRRRAGLRDAEAKRSTKCRSSRCRRTSCPRPAHIFEPRLPSRRTSAPA